MRMPTAMLPALVLAAGLPVSTPAAEALPALRAHIHTAMLAAKSYVADVKGNGFATQTTFVAPNRYRAVLSYNGLSREMILIGGQGYVGAGDGSYRAVSAPPEVVATQTQLTDVPVDAVLADVTEGGVTYGRFQTTSAGPQRDAHFTCTYDKRTYRLAACTGTTLAIVFSRYDDPANVVNAPVNVAAPAAGKSR